MSPDTIARSEMIERFTVGFSRPFSEAIKIADKGIRRGTGFRQYHLIAVDFPSNVVAWQQPEREADRSRNSSLSLSGDST